MPTPMKSCLVLMAKAPEPGRVKTRLTPPLSAHQAATLYDAMLNDCLDASYAPRDWQLVLAFWPPEKREFFERLKGKRNIHLIPQEGADLPIRMCQVLETLTKSFERVVMRNTDSPQIPSDRLREAFASLSSPDDVVFGPDRGGGYYLVGLREFQKHLFDAEPSTPNNYQETIRRGQTLGLKITELEEELDLDHFSDLEELSEKLKSNPQAASVCPRTQRCLLEQGWTVE